MDTTELDFQDFLGDGDNGGRRMIDCSVLDQEDHVVCLIVKSGDAEPFSRKWRKKESAFQAWLVS